LLYCDALRVEECRGNISESYEYNLLRAYTQNSRCYADDIVVKNCAKDDHIVDLKTVFDIMWAHQLKMNSTKSFMGVASSKFLGFIVAFKGIYLNLEKVCAIQETQPPRNLRELRGLQG